MIPNGVIFGIIEQKFENCRSKIDGAKKWICSTPRITHIAFFGKQPFPHYQTPLPTPIYYHLLKLSILYQLLYHIFNTIISILQYCYSYVIHCNYIVTIIISITYRYNLSIKLPLTRKRQHIIINIDIIISIK